MKIWILIWLVFHFLFLPCFCTELKSENDGYGLANHKIDKQDPCGCKFYNKDPPDIKIDNEGSPDCTSGQTLGNIKASQSRDETCSRSGMSATLQNVPDPGKNYVSAHPSYLKTLGQTHSDWIFGAIAEFVDNSRDAKATM